MQRTRHRADLGIVRFQLDAPLCGTTLPVRFSVDGYVAATDTFVVGSPGHSHTTYDLIIPVGAHTVRTELWAPFLNDWRSVDGWSDKRVDVRVGKPVIDTLSFYCS